MIGSWILSRLGYIRRPGLMGVLVLLSRMLQKWEKFRLPGKHVRDIKHHLILRTFQYHTDNFLKAKD